MVNRLWKYLSLSGGALLVGAGLVVGAIAVVFGGEHALSRTEFCVSCHSQTYPYEELKKSSHYGALGADPGCKDCHVPQGLGNFHLAVWTHVYDGTRAVLAEMKYDSRRSRNSTSAGRSWPTMRACRSRIGTASPAGSATRIPSRPAHRQKPRTRRWKRRAPPASIATRTWRIKKSLRRISMPV